MCPVGVRARTNNYKTIFHNCELQMWSQCVFTTSNRYKVHLQKSRDSAAFNRRAFRVPNANNNYKTIFHNRELQTWLQCVFTPSNWYAPLKVPGFYSLQSMCFRKARFFSSRVDGFLASPMRTTTIKQYFIIVNCRRGYSMFLPPPTGTHPKLSAFFLRSSSVYNNYKTIFHNREL
jgi:hypothetical protein